VSLIPCALLLSSLVTASMRVAVLVAHRLGANTTERLVAVSAVLRHLNLLPYTRIG